MFPKKTIWRRRLIKRSILLSMAVVLGLLVGEVVTRLFFGHCNFELVGYFCQDSKIFKSPSGITGTFVFRNGKGKFRFNNEGWNSTRDYFRERQPGVLRVACIGSSDTLGLYTDTEDGYPQAIENELNSQGIRSEVYSFGRGSMHLAQSLHVARHVVAEFDPDIVTITGVREGFLVRNTPYSYYMALAVDGEGNVSEVPPTDPYDDTLLGDLNLVKSVLERSCFLKYLFLNLDLKARLLNLDRRITASINQEPYVPYANRETAYDIAFRNSTSYRRDHEIGQRYLLGQFDHLREKHQTEIVFVFGPSYLAPENPLPFEASYNQDLFRRLEVLERKEERRRVLKEMLQDSSLPYVDLTEAFAADFRENRIRFDFLHDGHLNEHGNHVQGRAIARYLMESRADR